MPKDTPETYTSDQLFDALGDLEKSLEKARAAVLASRDVMVSDAILEITVANNGPWERAEVDMKRWARAVERATDKALKERKAMKRLNTAPKRKPRKKP